MSRPASVTIAAWIIIVLGIVGAFLMSPGISKAPLTGLQLAFSYVGLAIAVVSGIFMLMGKNWSRWLYIVWCILGLAYALATTPNPVLLIPGALKTAIIAYVLFRRPANSFFTRVASKMPAGA